VWCGEGAASSSNSGEEVEESERRRWRSRPGWEEAKFGVKGGRRRFLCVGDILQKKFSVKNVIFDSFSVSWIFYEKSLQHKSIFRKLYRYLVISNLLERAQNHDLNHLSPIPKTNFRNPICSH